MKPTNLAVMVLENQFGELSINTIMSQDGAVPGVLLESNEAGAIRGAASQSTMSLGTVYGSDTFTDPGSAFGVRGFVSGANLTKNFNTCVGAAGYYSITGTNASQLPKCGIMGVIGDTTTSADAAVMAYLDGDGGSTTARCGYGIMMLNSTGSSKFDYGMDLKLQTVSGHTSFSRAYGKADLRLSNDIVLLSAAGAPVDGTTGLNFAGPGSIYINITTGKMYLQSSAAATPAWKIVTSA